MDSRLYEKILKIRNLADRGSEGEKENAEVLLQKLLEKYNLTEEELILDEVTEHEFRFYGHLGEKLFSQIVYAVLGDVDIYYYTHKRNCKSRFVHCTNSEALEINEMFEFYRYYLDEGFLHYYRAFVQVESIFPSQDKVKVFGKKDDIPEDVIKLAAMMNKHERHLRIEEHSSNINK